MLLPSTASWTRAYESAPLSAVDNFDAERPNAADWDTVTLAGWDGESGFRSSDWRLTNTVRYLDSIAFPKGVYTPATQTELESARSAAETLMESVSEGTRPKAETAGAADRLEAAIRGLRWADMRYPESADLPVRNTLPNPYRFFGDNRLVRNVSDWEARRAEILRLAQFYEYGFKPEPPNSIEVMQIKHVNVGENISAFRWNGQDYSRKTASEQEQITIKITVGDKTAELTYTVYLPTAEQRNNPGHADGPKPVVLSFDGDNELYRDAGYAVVIVPQGSGGDVRTNEYAWGTRTGTF